MLKVGKKKWVQPMLLVLFRTSSSAMLMGGCKWTAGGFWGPQSLKCWIPVVCQHTADTNTCLALCDNPCPAGYEIGDPDQANWICLCAHGSPGCGASYICACKDRFDRS